MYHHRADGRGPWLGRIESGACMRLGSTGRAGMLAFLAAGVTLFVQVLVHRMVSAKLLNNFAFLAVAGVAAVV